MCRQQSSQVLQRSYKAGPDSSADRRWVTEYSRAEEFVTSKFSAGRNISSERIKLYSTKQKSNQSLNDFLSELRQIGKFCNFPNAFSDEALRDAFCQRTQPNEPFAEDSQQLIRKDKHFHWTMQFRQRKWRKPPSNLVDLWR